MSETSSAQKKAVLTEHFFMRDMAQTLANIYSYLSDSGLFFFVVGNNVIEDQPIDLHTYLQSISGNLHQLSTTNIDTTYTHLGSAFDIITNRELFQSRNHDGGVIECEWVLALQK
jgi:hypothetical protein